MKRSADGSSELSTCLDLGSCSVFHFIVDRECELQSSCQ